MPGEDLLIPATLCRDETQNQALHWKGWASLSKVWVHGCCGFTQTNKSFCFHHQVPSSLSIILTQASSSPLASRSSLALFLSFHMPMLTCQPTSGQTRGVAGILATPRGQQVLTTLLGSRRPHAHLAEEGI